MSFSYDPTQLKTSLKDQVRLRIGDTEEESAFLSDEEIEYFISISSSVSGACYKAASSIIAKISSLPEYTLGPYKEEHGNRIEAMKSLQQSLMEESGKLHSPIMKSPTTGPIFSYDFMSSACHIKKEDDYG